MLLDLEEAQEREWAYAEEADPPAPPEVPIAKPRFVSPSSTKSKLLALTLDELIVHKFTHRRALLCRDNIPIFREGDLGQIYAPRGIGKTWAAETLALIAASHVEALGLRAPEPRNVLYIDGEMGSEEVQERFIHLRALLGIDSLPNLVILGADWQEDYLPRLDTFEGQLAVEPFIAPADLIFLDNRSCLLDSEGETDPTAWQPAQDWLLKLRRRGKAVLMIHHANRQGGARGLSKAEDLLNLILKLSRPSTYSQDQGARFLVEFDKARGIHGAAAAPFTATLTPKGWTVEVPEVKGFGNSVKDKLLGYLGAADAVGENRAISASAWVGLAKVGRTEGFIAIKAMEKAGEISRDAGGVFHAE